MLGRDSCGGDWVREVEMSLKHSDNEGVSSTDEFKDATLPMIVGFFLCCVDDFHAKQELKSGAARCRPKPNKTAQGASHCLCRGNPSDLHIYLFIEGLSPSQPHRVTSGLSESDLRNHQRLIRQSVCISTGVFSKFLLCTVTGCFGVREKTLENCQSVVDVQVVYI